MRGVEELTEMAFVYCSSAVRYEYVDRLSEELPRGVTKENCHRGTSQHDLVTPVDNHHGVGTGGKYLAKESF
jgi:hypothetical protein